LTIARPSCLAVEEDQTGTISWSRSSPLCVITCMLLGPHMSTSSLSAHRLGATASSHVDSALDATPTARQHLHLPSTLFSCDPAPLAEEGSDLAVQAVKESTILLVVRLPIF
jgi:hypothetical protein